MSSSLSDEEFHRMQLQLIELRTENYTINDKCKRQDIELQSLRKHNETAAKDLERANKAVSKSKKAKEVELLIQETESLQRKLISQEEEFQLQNSTLMQELSLLVATNEKLQKELDDQQKNKGESNDDSTDGELRRVRAQNIALQQSLTACQESQEKEVTELKQTIHTLQQINTETSRERRPPAGCEREDECDGQVVQGDGDMDHTEPTSLNASMMELVSRAENKTLELEDQLKELSNLRLNLDTEKEENKILKEQLLSYEGSSKDQIATLQADLEKLTEKVKRKQESIVQLQAEKEKLYTTSNKKIEELEQTNKRHSQNARETTAKLQDDLAKSTKQLEEERTKASERIGQLEQAVSSLQTQVNSASEEANKHLQDDNAHLQHTLKELQEKVQLQSQTIDDLKLQLGESQKAVTTTLQQLCDAQKERDLQIQTSQEASRLAEKRKSMLDELAIKYQEDIDRYKESVKTVEREAAEKKEDERVRYQREYDDLLDQLEEAKGKIKELEKLSSEVTPLKVSLQSAEEARDWLDRRLKEMEENTEEMKAKYEEDIQGNQVQKEEEIKNLEETHEVEIKGLQVELAECKTTEDSQKATIIQLRQEIKDSLDGKKLHEKKGASVLKDLKRQLNAEKKKAEKLQDKLRELITETKGNPDSIEDLFQHTHNEDRYRGDNSSVSSLGASGNSYGKDTSPPSQSPTNQPSPSQDVLEQENNELLTKLGDLQQSHWYLEEKLSHLETSNAAMAEDLLQKQAIIEHYALEGRPEFVPPAAERIHKDKLTVKRVIDFVKDKGDENMKEVNRKLQRMLEETLTKNVHLQENLEMMSQEVQRLSQASNTTVDENTEPHEADITS